MIMSRAFKPEATGKHEPDIDRNASSKFGGAGGQGGCGISILLGSAWNLPLVWKSAFGHAKGAGGATLAAHNGLTGSRCEHLTRTRRRVASASSKDAPGV